MCPAGRQCSSGDAKSPLQTDPAAPGDGSGIFFGATQPVAGTWLFALSPGPAAPEDTSEATDSEGCFGGYDSGCQSPGGRQTPGGQQSLGGQSLGGRSPGTAVPGADRLAESLSALRMTSSSAGGSSRGRRTTLSPLRPPSLAEPARPCFADEGTPSALLTCFYLEPPAWSRPAPPQSLDPEILGPSLEPCLDPFPNPSPEPSPMPSSLGLSGHPEVDLERVQRPGGIHLGKGEKPRERPGVQSEGVGLGGYVGDGVVGGILDLGGSGEALKVLGESECLRPLWSKAVPGAVDVSAAENVVTVICERGTIVMLSGRSGSLMR